MVQLKGKEVLLSSNEESNNKELTFWNLNNYNKIHTMEGHDPYILPHMKEISDSIIALVKQKDSCYYIAIIDTSSYKEKTIIYEDIYITNYSSLCVLNEYSFVFASNGNFVQIFK